MNEPIGRHAPGGDYWINMDTDIHLMRGDVVIATWTDEEITANPRKFIDIARCCGDNTYDMDLVLSEYGIQH